MTKIYHLTMTASLHNTLTMFVSFAEVRLPPNPTRHGGVRPKWAGRGGAGGK